MKYLGQTTNNVAEYLALLYALEEAQARGVTELLVRTDSELLAKQVSGEYRVRDETLRLFHDLAIEKMRHFASCRVRHVGRQDNAAADHLAAAAVESRFDTAVKRVPAGG